MIPLPPISSLLPYTTLFRSRSPLPPRTQFQPQWWSLLSAAGAGKRSEPCHSSAAATVVASRIPHFAIIGRPGSGAPPHYARSEEHTSELQSLTNLVCRLLLE